MNVLVPLPYGKISMIHLRISACMQSQRIYKTKKKTYLAARFGHGVISYVVCLDQK